MDGLTNYSELLVAKKPDAKTVIARLMIILLFVLTLAASIVAMATVQIVKIFVAVLPMLWLFVGLLCWYLWGNTNIEYEYAIVSGYLQLDEIINKKRRKQICEVKLSEIKACASVSASNQKARDPSGFSKVIFAAGDKKSQNLFYIIYNDNKKGNVLLYIEVSKKTLDCICFYNRNAVDRGNL